MCGRSSAGMPAPVSVTVSTASGPACRVAMVTGRPAGVNFSALLSRLVITWCSQCGSASTGAPDSCRVSVMPATSNRRARLSAALAARSARSLRRRARCRLAASAAASVCRSPTMRASRSTSSRSDRQLVRRWLGHPVQQRLVPGLQHRDRGAQLVRDVGDQIPAQLLLPVHRAGHLIEGGRQLAQLTGRADLADARGAVSARHRPGHRDQPGDRAGDPPGHGEPGEQGQQGREAGRARDGPQQRGLQDPVGGPEAGTGGPDHGRPDPLAAGHHRRARLRPVVRAESGRGGDDAAGLVADLDVRTGAGGEVQDGGKIGGGPAVVPVPIPPRRPPPPRRSARYAGGWPGWRRPRR